MKHIHHRWEVVEWPPYPYGVVARGTPIFSVFDRYTDRHVFWHKEEAECEAFIDRRKNPVHKSNL